MNRIHGSWQAIFISGHYQFVLCMVVVEWKICLHIYHINYSSVVIVKIHACAHTHMSSWHRHGSLLKDVYLQINDDYSRRVFVVYMHTHMHLYSRIPVTTLVTQITTDEHYMSCIVHTHAFTFIITTDNTSGFQITTDGQYVSCVCTHARICCHDYLWQHL